MMLNQERTAPTVPFAFCTEDRQSDDEKQRTQFSTLYVLIRTLLASTYVLRAGYYGLWTKRYDPKKRSSWWSESVNEW